jgi:hypothetical protein
MQESTLTKNKIPGPNRKLMQQADGSLPLSPWKGQECLRRSPNCFIRPVWCVNLMIKNIYRKHKNGLFLFN